MKRRWRTVRLDGVGMAGFAVMFCLLALGSGCGGGGATAQVGDDGLNTLQLTVIPDRLNISGGGNCAVKVVLWDENGQPLEGVVNVTTTLGKLSATSLATEANADGATASAVTTLSPADQVTVGNAVVTATFGTIQVWVSVEFYRTLGS